jgi:hypothetical protein
MIPAIAANKPHITYAETRTLVVEIATLRATSGERPTA